MPCEVDWLIAKRLIRAGFYGVVTADDIRQQTAETFELIAKGDPPVHILLDSSGVESIGIGIGDLRNLSVSTLPQAGWTIIIAPNTLYRFFISVGMQFTRSAYKFVESSEEAVEFLKSQDPTMKPSAD